MTSPLLPAPSDSSAYPSENFQLFNASVDSTSGVPHRLTITASGYDSFLLDYIILESSSAFISSLDGENSSSTTTGSGTTQSSDSHGHGKSLNVGALAGGVVGGVIILAVIGIGLFLRMRWRGERRGGRRREFNAESSLEGEHVSTGIGARWQERRDTDPIIPSRRPVTPTESGR